MKKLLEGFPTAKGVVCITTSIRNAIRSQTGERISEDLIFGLGSGLFFAYSQIGDIEGIAGIAGDMIPVSFCANVTAQMMTEESVDDDFECIRDMIDHGYPVMVQMYGSEDAETDAVLSGALSLPMDLHNALVTGYDTDENTVHIVDHRVNMDISIESFYKRRHHKRLRMYFLLPEKIDLKSSVFGSIKRVTDFWLRMPEHPKFLADHYTRYLRLGVVRNTKEGMLHFKDHFMTAEKVQDIEKLKMALLFMRGFSYQSSGGDMTRGMYSRYLKEAAGITGDGKLLEISRAYGVLARDWRTFFKWFFDDTGEVIKKLCSDKGQQELAAIRANLCNKEMAAIGMLDEVWRAHIG